MIRETLRNNYSTLGWWDGDRNTTNNDRQRAEVKNLGGTAYQQKTDQTYEYSYDFRTDPDFIGTNHFCHIFQLKATDETDVGSGGIAAGHVIAVQKRKRHARQASVPV